MHQNVGPMGHSGGKVSRGQISLRNTPNSPPLLGDSQCTVAYLRLWGCLAGEDGFTQHFPNSPDGTPFVAGLVVTHGATVAWNAL